MKTRIQNMIHTSQAKQQKQVINHIWASPNGGSASVSRPIVAESRRIARKGRVSAIETNVSQPVAGSKFTSTKQQKLVINQLLANPQGRLLSGVEPIVAESRRISRKSRASRSATGTGV